MFIEIKKFVSTLALVLFCISPGHASGNGSETPFFNIDKMIINLAPPDMNRYLQISFAYEMTDPAIQEHLEAYLPVIRSRLLLVLSTKTAEEIKTVKGKQDLLDQVLDVARISLPVQIPLTDSENSADRGIKDVHITSIVVQ